MLLLLLITACAPKENKTDPATPATRPTPKPANDSDIVIQNKGFATPESVLYDKHNDRYLISNINGQPTDKDDNGFISIVDPNGKVTNPRWIDGAAEDIVLHAPKGMGILDQKLYVSDIDTIRVFDFKTGKPLSSIPIKDAQFLNDIATNPYQLYISDTGTNSIHKIAKSGEIETVIQDPKLNGPNGLALRGQDIYVVSFGANQMHVLSAQGTITTTTEFPTGGLDGIAIRPDGSTLVSSWDGKKVYVRTVDGSIKAPLTNIEAPADIAWDSKRNRVLVPMFKANQIWIHPLKSNKK